MKKSERREIGLVNTITEYLVELSLSQNQKIADAASLILDNAMSWQDLVEEARRLEHEAKQNQKTPVRLRGKRPITGR